MKLHVELEYILGQINGNPHIESLLITLLGCIATQNLNGVKNYRHFLAHPEDKETYQEAKMHTLKIWLLRRIMSDLKFLDGPERKEYGFEYGRSGDHIWVHINKKRVMMIYVR